MKIFPTIIAKNQKEFYARYNKLKKIPVLHLDIMDGKFVKSRSMWFWPKFPKHKFEAHLMINNPEEYIKTHNNIYKFLVHIETVKDFNSLLKLIRKRKKQLFLVLNPSTPVSRIKKYLNKIDGVMVLTVKPGKYGAKFMPSMVKKIKLLRKLKPKMHIQVDGGVNLTTVKTLHKAGADCFSVGSYLQKHRNIKKALKDLYSKTR